MSGDASDDLEAKKPQADWAGWQRRCFIGVVLVVELAFISAMLACLIGLWNALDFS